MPAELRFAAVLVGSLVLGSPAIAACVSGHIAPGTAATRVAGAVVLAWLAVRALASALPSSSPAGGTGAARDADADVEPEVPRRRADDAPAPGDPATDDSEVAAAAEP